MARALRQAAGHRGRGSVRRGFQGNEGLIAGDLGSGVMKQRIARRNEGRSRGFRSIILFRRGDSAVFVYGFAKSDHRNLQRDELEVYRSFADEVLGYEEADLAKTVGPNKWKELEGHGKDPPERAPRGNP